MERRRSESARSFRFVPRVTALGTVPDTGDLLARLASHAGLAALDSAGGAPRRWSVLAFDPLAGLELPADLARLREFTRALDSAQIDDPSGADALPGPFHGGFIGALSYDLGVLGETSVMLPDDPWGSPRVLGGLYVDFVVRDERTEEGWLVLGDAIGDGRAPIAERRARVLGELATPAAFATDPAGADALGPLGPLVRHTPRAEHERRIETLREWIAAGDLYQANLAHRFTRRMRGHPIALYRRLRAVNAAPYMGFLAFDERTSARVRSDRRDDAGGIKTDAGVAPASFRRGALLSASPELLLEFDGRVARTRPIKGTAPRGATRAEDLSNQAALLASAKDRAELAMIVDLERNDLGRCARVGTVRVERFPALATYATVHHLSADVTAEIAPGRDAFDLLAALFPGGSITGAPKSASMRAIAALEGEGRGFFSGAAGFVDTRGRCAFNILIRTLVWRPEDGDEPPSSRQGVPHVPRGEVSFHVGGGITWSSDAAAEDRETLAKGAAMARALEVERAEPVAGDVRADAVSASDVPSGSRKERLDGGDGALSPEGAPAPG